jgi:predicted nucleic-acid-binding Zn-ribbon protein
MEGMMDEEIKCPKCGSHKIKKAVARVGVGAKGPFAKLPEPTEEYISYRCLRCDKVFDEDDLLEPKLIATKMSRKSY